MPKGVCRYCGCTGEKPCRYVPNLHAPPAGRAGLDGGVGRQNKDLVYESRMLREGGEGEIKRAAQNGRFSDICLIGPSSADDSAQPKTYVWQAGR